MTLRHADVAYVLERVAGVRAVYAIDALRGGAKRFDMAVAVERGGDVLAGVHYALLRVMPYEEIPRVLVFHSAPPPFLSAAREIVLNERERAAARARVPDPAPRPPIVAHSKSARPLRVIVVDQDRTIEPVVHDAFPVNAFCIKEPNHVAAARLLRETDFDAVLCDSSRAFGLDGLLARVPLDIAELVIVLAEPSELEAARRRLQGDERLLEKPLTAAALRQRVAIRPTLTFAAVTHAFHVPDVHRSCEKPASSAPFTAVLVDVPEDLSTALRRVLPIHSRHLSRTDVESGVELLLSTPWHVAFVSAKAALATKSLLTLVAREDRKGAERIVVVAPARDVPHVKHSLARDQRDPQRVLALPIDDATLLREILRDHSELTERLALEDKDPFPSPPPRTNTRGRVHVLFVDDDVTTQMLVSAASPLSNADLTLATSAMSAFQHLASATIDVLVVSASMRSDGGEAIYRLLWRLDPTLKARTVLVTSAHVDPRFSALAAAHSDRIVARPLTAQVVGRIVEIYAAN